MMAMIHQFWAICALLTLLSANAEKKADKNEYASPDKMTSTGSHVITNTEPFTATGPLATGYYNIFSGYGISGIGCTIISPQTPLTISSWALGSCQPYMTTAGLKNTILSMTTDYLTLYADVYTAQNCTGTPSTFKTGLQSQTMGCTWSYTTSAVPAMQQSPTTLAAINTWTTTYYYTSAATCSAKAISPYVYQAQVSVTVPCISTCTLNSNGNGFYQTYQNCQYNPLYAPTAAPVPTASPTLVTANKNAIIAGSVVGGLLLLALCCGLYYCFGGESKKEEDEYERLRVDRA